MASLSGRRVALLESRHGSDIATLVRRLGGVPVSAPSVDEVPCHDDCNTFVDGLTERRFSLAIFQTGTGIKTLFDEAERRGRLAQAIDALRQTTIACRGAKPLAVLKRYGLRAQVTTARPHTTQELLRALSHQDVAERGVLLIHHGERNVEVADALRQRGARLQEICPYQWALPDDLEPMSEVVRDIVARRLDAVLFTSQIQCRHLFKVASDLGLTHRFVSGLNSEIVVGAVGPVCAARLREFGVVPDVIPSAPNIVALISALAEYFDLTDTANADS
jgi:uroporphyrinogen-III synthase